MSSTSFGAAAAAFSGIHLIVTGVTCIGKKGFKQDGANLAFKTWKDRLTYHNISAVALMVIFACLVTGKAKAQPDDDAVAHAMYTSSLSILAVLVSITIMNKGDATRCRDPYTVFKFLLLAILTAFTCAAAATA
jgi:hypothetical protein